MPETPSWPSTRTPSAPGRRLATSAAPGSEITCQSGCAPSRPRTPRESSARWSEAVPDEAPRHDVLLGHLCHNEISTSFHSSLLELIGHDVSTSQRLEGWAKVRSGPLNLPESRNELCKRLLAGPAQWLFILDSDMGFEADTLD